MYRLTLNGNFDPIENWSATYGLVNTALYLAIGSSDSNTKCCTSVDTNTLISAIENFVPIHE
jgi:hypothetical protein